MIARVARSRCPNAVFQPNFAETQSPIQAVHDLEIVLDSLREMGLCIGLTSHSDLMSLLMKGRKICEWELQEDSAIRILGETLSENEENKFHSSFVYQEALTLSSQTENATCFGRKTGILMALITSSPVGYSVLPSSFQSACKRVGFILCIIENGAPFDNSVFKLR